MSLKLYNTMGRSIQEFVPIRDGEVGMYCCGPTVYSYAHIGNLRTYVFEDLLRRVLERRGYRVRHVMNVTDVGHLTDDGDEGEDKMLVGARERGMTVWEIAEHFSEAFFTDARKLNVLDPQIICRATDHIPEMIDLIRSLEERGLTYAAGGNVYYRIVGFPEYGRMALLDRAELQAGARIAVDEQKQNPHDFALWFTNSKFEHQAMQWDSPWGRGYPGWHIECSAMSMKYLGERIDIHCGGVDHINVHHTNEIAQSEGSVGHRWVNYWLHGEFLIMESGRMGKSKGNVLTITALEEEGYHPLDYRYFLLGAHYRTQLTFTPEALGAARSARASLVSRLRELSAESGALPDDAPAVLDTPSEATAAALREIESAFDDDLNVPKALGLVRAFLRNDGAPAAERLAVALDCDAVFGLSLRESLRPSSWTLPAGAAELISEREEARRLRDYERADRLRERLRAMGVVIEDKPGGTEWMPG